MGDPLGLLMESKILFLEPRVQSEDENERKEKIEEMARLVSSWFVRKDSKFFDIKRMGVKLSRDDVERASLRRLDQQQKGEIDPGIVKAAFHRAIIAKHTDPDASIPVWNGVQQSLPGNPQHIVEVDGMVTVNCWSQPCYRDLTVEPTFGPVEMFLNWIFPIEAERRMIINWLAWCLQNEEDKPGWAPLLYSDEKGTGKSTFCELAAALFGKENSATQNNVKKLTSRFNATLLQSKLIISEELRLGTDSPEVNALKTYITERDAITELKGQDAIRIRQACAFLFTTNHLPTWIEGGDRRFYVVEVSHDGHASGPESDEFKELVRQVRDVMEDEKQLASLYRALLAHKIPADFSAQHMNPDRDGTAIMKRVAAVSERVIQDTLREYLEKNEVEAVAQATLVECAQNVLKCNPESIRHMMPKLRYSQQFVKWDGKDYTRAVWVADGATIYRGRLTNRAGRQEDLSEHMKEHTVPTVCSEY